jgi:hypothetical protein
MGRFVDFHFYWEEYSSYPDSDSPYGLPSLLWVIAKDHAACCQVCAAPKSASQAVWSATWRQVSGKLVRRLNDILEEVGAFGDLTPLVQSPERGDSLTVWEITGAIKDRSFRFSVEFTSPGERWSAIGEEFRAILAALRAAAERG